MKKVIISKKYLEKEYLNKNRDAKNLAKELGCCELTIRKSLKKFKLLKKDYKDKIRDSFYKETPEKYYWLGFIFADGGVMSKYDLSVGLSLKDYEHLEKLRQFYNPLAKISIQRRRYSSCRFCISGKKLIKYLENFGIIRRKSLLGIPKNIPEQFMKYWILGYFDGDGSIFQTKRGDYIVSIVGNKNTLEFTNEWIKEHCYKSLNIHPHKKIMQIRLGELDSYCLLAKLYDEENLKYCLKRKYTKFLEVKNKVENRFKSLISIYKK